MTATKGVEDGMGAKSVLCKFCHFTERNHIDGKYCSVNRIAEFKPAAVPVAILSAPVESANGIGKVFGTWPGDETDGQLLATLSEVRKPATTEVRGKASPEMEELIGRMRAAAIAASESWTASGPESYKDNSSLPGSIGAYYYVAGAGARLNTSMADAWVNPMRMEGPTQKRAHFIYEASPENILKLLDHIEGKG